MIPRTIKKSSSAFQKLSLIQSYRYKKEGRMSNYDVCQFCDPEGWLGPSQQPRRASNRR